MRMELISKIKILEAGITVFSLYSNPNSIAGRCVSELLPPQILHPHCHVLQKHTELKGKPEKKSYYEVIERL